MTETIRIHANQQAKHTLFKESAWQLKEKTALKPHLWNISGFN